MLSFHEYFSLFSPWESKHGALLGLRVVVMMSEPEVESQIHVELRQAALKILTDQEVRVRQAAGKQNLCIK